MGIDALSKYNTVTECFSSALKSLTKRCDQRKKRQAAEAAEAERLEAIRQKNAFLTFITTKVSGPSLTEMAPLIYHPATTKAVFLVTIPIAFGSFEVSGRTYKLLARHVGMSLDSVSHWAVCVVDRGLGESWCYDLMSDRLEFSMLGRNYFRVGEVTERGVQSWSSCYYVGETGKSHEEIQESGRKHMTLNPRYHLLSSNCQHLVETLVKDLCDGKVISQAKLNEELALASPKIARDLLVARLRSKVDVAGEREDSETVQEDVRSIKQLWEVMRHR